MKARIRKTGEIVDVICYGGIPNGRSKVLDYVNYIDSQGVEHTERNNLNFYWDFEPIDTTADGYWQEVRERAAIAAMGKLIGMGRDDGYKYSPLEVAKFAVVYANALVEQLKEKLSV